MSPPPTPPTSPSHTRSPSPPYSGNFGHGTRHLSTLPPQHRSASNSPPQPGSSLRDFKAPPSSSPHTTTTEDPGGNDFPSGMAGHGSRGPQEGLDLDAEGLRGAGGVGVRDVVGSGGMQGGGGRGRRYNPEGERRGYGSFAEKEDGGEAQGREREREGE